MLGYVCACMVQVACKVCKVTNNVLFGQAVDGKITLKCVAFAVYVPSFAVLCGVQI